MMMDLIYGLDTEWTRLLVNHEWTIYITYLGCSLIHRTSLKIMMRIPITSWIVF